MNVPGGFVFAFLLALVKGAEWHTSGGKHCIEKCKSGSRKGLDRVYSCKAVIGDSREFRPQERDKEKYDWDYCTPATVQALYGGEVFQEKEEAVVLPERVDRDKREAGFNPGSPSKFPASSLAGIDCSGRCEENAAGKYKCDVPTHNPNNFFCSPQIDLKRQQLSSHNKLWCLSDCVKSPSDAYYTCRTLYGWDRCSPAADRSSKGNKCEKACQLNPESSHHHYQCLNDTTGKHWEDCGYWHVTDLETNALQFTQNNQVCAGPCTKVDNDLTCSYVEWDWNEEENVAKLEMGIDFCGGSDLAFFSKVILLISIILIYHL